MESLLTSRYLPMPFLADREALAEATTQREDRCCVEPVN